MREDIQANQHAHRSFPFILITVVVDGTGLGLMLPILPLLFVELTGESVPQAAIHGGWLSALFSIVQFFTAPVLGNLSDRFGRKPILLGSLTAFGIGYLLIGFSQSIGWIALSTILLGAFSATMSTASAYVADVTEPRDRVGRFGIIAAAYGAGFVLGPMLAGLLQTYGTRAPFVLAGILTLLNVVYGFFVVPESLRMENRRAFSIVRANPFGAYAQLRDRPPLMRLLVALMLIYIAAGSVSIIWGYFTILKFGWSQGEIGLSLSLSAAAGVLVQSVLASRMSRWFGTLRTMCVGFTCMILGLLGYAFASQGWIMLVSIIPAAMGLLATAALTGELSNQVSTDTQGELQGAISSMVSAASVVTPIIMTQLLSLFSGQDAVIYFPGMPYLLAAVIAAWGFYLGARAVKQGTLKNARIEARS
jgi:DHA1 family tetracycline resistance protein-like MFS transporter